MPLLKGTAGKAMPDMAIGYVTRKDKARYIDVQNLFIDEDYAAQLPITAVWADWKRNTSSTVSMTICISYQAYGTGNARTTV